MIGCLVIAFSLCHAGYYAQPVYQQPYYPPQVYYAAPPPAYYAPPPVYAYPQPQIVVAPRIGWGWGGGWHGHHRH